VQKKPLRSKTVYFGCRKRFLCPDDVLLHCEWAKTFPVQEKPIKIKTVYFGCRKRFLCPEAVINYCEWAKNVPCAKETAKKQKRFISDAESVFFVPKL